MYVILMDYEHSMASLISVFFQVYTVGRKKWETYACVVSA